VQTLDKI